MKALIEMFGFLVSMIVPVAIVLWLVAKANTTLNQGLPKVGKGKKARGSGDVATEWTRRQVYNAGRTTGRLVWNLAKRPFK